MFAWLFGKREPVRKVLFRGLGFNAIVTVRKMTVGWTGRIAPIGRHGILRLKDDGTTLGYIGTWEPVSGWPLSEFPVVPLENAK